MRYPTSTLLVSIAFSVLIGTSAPAITNLTFKADAIVKETFDSNVYLQDVQPDLVTVPNAAPPHHESFVTTVSPRVALDYHPAPAFNVLVAYTPEAAFYHSASSEDYVAHRGSVVLSGKAGNFSWEQANSATFTDGDDHGLYFGGPGGPPAIGGIPIRDRRDAFMYRGGFRMTLTLGKWFVRPITSAYVHDFFTRQLNNTLPQFKGYENYVDRNDVNGGLDVGYEVFKNARVVGGYRYGYQNEGALVTEPFQYDNQYHRVLVGFEGQPAPWVKLSLFAGPDFHHSTALVRTNFDGNYTVLYADCAATFLPSPNDTIAIMVRQFTQPAFGSCSVYQDTTYDLVWRHKIDDHWATSAGFRAYVGDWRPPVKREDWIYTVSAGVSWALNPKLSFDAAYSYDWVDSAVPNTSGREFTRHLASIAAKYVF